MRWVKAAADQVSKSPCILLGKGPQCPNFLETEWKFWASAFNYFSIWVGPCYLQGTIPGSPSVTNIQGLLNLWVGAIREPQDVTRAPFQHLWKVYQNPKRLHMVSFGLRKPTGGNWKLICNIWKVRWGPPVWFLYWSQVKSTDAKTADKRPHI